MQRGYVIGLSGLLLTAACLDRKPISAVDGAGTWDGPTTEAAALSGTGGAGGIDLAPGADLGQVVDGPGIPDVPITSPDTRSVDAPAGSGGSIGTGGSIATGTGGMAGVGSGGTTGTGGTTSSPDAPPALLPNGTICTAGTACTSGSCVDGVCCNNPCSGCNACTRALTGQADGSCAPVTTGLDPHTNCADETATNQCGNDGACDGLGACRKVATSHQCAAAKCEGTTFTPASNCNGTGACTSVASQNCGSFQCSASDGCKTTCTLQADCGANSYCNTGTGSCLAKVATGGVCTQALACVSGSCVDGVCCENACPGACKACSAAKTGASDGLCRPVKVATDPDNECTPDSSNACGLDGTCDGISACRYQITGTACGTASCAGQGTYTPRGQCNGSGTCIAGSPGSCPNNMLCASSTACTTTCTDRSTTGCPAGYKCVGGNSCAAAIVTCGSTSCPVGNGQKCCVTNDPSVGGTNAQATYTCLPQGQTCSMSSTIQCNSTAECPSGQVCCNSGYSSLYPNQWTIGCTSNCYIASPGFYYQVCDPNLSPPECQAGTCQSFAAGIPGIYACQ